MPRRVPLRSFVKAKSGVAALEFALVLPLMLTMYLGSVEATELLLADKRVETIASSVSDIVARQPVMNLAALQDLEESLPRLMAPANTDGLGGRVTSISVDAAGNARVVWSYSLGGMPALAPGSVPPNMDARLLNANHPSLVRSEITLDYNPAIEFVFGGVFSLAHVDSRHTRLANPLTCTDCP